MSRSSVNTSWCQVALHLYLRSIYERAQAPGSGVQAVSSPEQHIMCICMIISDISNMHVPHAGMV